MTTASQVLTIAGREVGYSRWDDEEQGTKYGRWFGIVLGRGSYFASSGVPYCAMFVSWVLDQAGTTFLGNMYAYVPWMVSATKRAGREIGKTAASPGDIIMFDWDGDGLADHVGFVAANHPASGVMETIEGNTSASNAGSQSDGGVVARRVRYYSDICCVCSMPYSGAATGFAENAWPNGRNKSDGQGTIVQDGVAGPATWARFTQVMGTGIAPYMTIEATRQFQAWLAADDGIGLAHIQNLCGGPEKYPTRESFVDGEAGADTWKAFQFWVWNRYHQDVINIVGHEVAMPDWCDGDPGEWTITALQVALNRAVANSGNLLSPLYR